MSVATAGISTPWSPPRRRFKAKVGWWCGRCAVWLAAMLTQEIPKPQSCSLSMPRLYELIALNQATLNDYQS